MAPNNTRDSQVDHTTNQSVVLIQGIDAQTRIMFEGMWRPNALDKSKREWPAMKWMEMIITEVDALLENLNDCSLGPSFVANKSQHQGDGT